MIDASNLARILDEELSRFTILATREEFTKLLCSPRLEFRVWHQNSGRIVPVWIVVSIDEMNLLFAYSREGYVDPWGLLSSTDDALGMDDRWYLHLEDALIGCGAWKGELPPDYEVR